MWKGDTNETENEVFPTSKPALIFPLIAESSVRVRFAVACWTNLESARLVGRGRRGPSTGQGFQEGKGVREESTTDPNKQRPVKAVARRCMMK